MVRNMVLIVLEADDDTLPPGFLRRTVVPAVAMVVLYASIRSLPALLVSQTPPIDEGDLLGVFVSSLVVFSLFGLYNEYKANRKGPKP